MSRNLDLAAHRNRSVKFRNANLMGASFAVLLTGAPAAAQIETVVVTAEKREEAANTVPMSITAVSADRMQAAGVDQVRDLAKLAPSFHYADSYVGSPVYTLRGIGFSDISLGGRPTVSVYSDQAPLPFAIETRGVNLDLERVEILEGPQGTLFGQNSTGGAINFIAARPTDSFLAGFDVSAGNFGALDAHGFVSGPLSDTVEGRIAIAHSQMNDWQTSYTTGAKNGAGDFTNGRVLLDWDPTSALSVQLNLNGWIDRSDVQAGQLVEVKPEIPPLAPFVPGLLGYPVAPHNDRAADFNPGLDYGRDNSFFQANLRADYRWTDNWTLTSLSSYSHFSEDQLQDIDGTALSNISQQTFGKIDSFFEELRVAADFDHWHGVTGVNFAHDRVSELGYVEEPQSTIALAFSPPLATFRDISNQSVTTWAAFINGNYNVTDSVSLYGGLRYTRMNNNFNGCTADSGDGVAAAAFAPLFGPIPVGGCVTVDATFTPGLVRNKLDEDNVSWRGGAQWTPSDVTMLYANISKGYKAGGFPTLGATVATQLSPAKQESLLAYEAGFKLTLADNTLQLNGAGFYYDYHDKQILGKVVDPFLGPLLKLVNVPKSQVSGVEVQLTWAPIENLNVSGGASYIASEVLDHFTNFDPFGNLVDFNGEAFPNTPKWHLVGSADYRFNLNDNLDGFVGANVTYEDKTNSQLGELPSLAVNAYTLVDLRAGIASRDNQWRLTVWGRNVGNTYYWTAANADLDTTVRFAGMPATYGVTLTFRSQ